jgi:V/A-type H+-transporting ATPase subunit F
MYKIAVIGGLDTVIGFKALGLEAHPVSGPDEARSVIRHLVSDDSPDDYAIIYLEETLAPALEADIARFRDCVTPAVILIPGREGSSGRSMTALHEAVKRAIGADILGQS